MKKYKNLFLLLLIFTLVTFMATLSGCGFFGKKQSSPQQNNQAEKIPTQLEQLDKTLEKVITALGGPTAEKQGAQKEGQQDQQQDQQQNQGEPQNRNQQQSQGGQQEQDQQQSEPPNQNQQQEQGQSQQQEQGQQQTPGQQNQTAAAKDPWRQSEADIQSLHTVWNEFMPEISKKGAGKEQLEGFSNHLNSLTEAAKTKDKNKTLLAANSLYGNISEFYTLYKTENPPALKRIIYYTRSIILQSQNGDWTKATKDLDDLKATWEIIKGSLTENQDGVIKLELSLYELEKVIKDKSKDLVDIKGRIVLSNVQELEKAGQSDGSST